VIQKLWLWLRLAGVIWWDAIRHPRSWSHVSVGWDGRIRVQRFDTQPVRCDDEECFALNAQQHRADLHPYTCGNDSSHRPLIATPGGWRCADCDYRQPFGGEVVAPPPE